MGQEPEQRQEILAAMQPNRHPACGTYSIISTGIDDSLFRITYIAVANSGNPAPTNERQNVFPAIAEAEFHL